MSYMPYIIEKTGRNQKPIDLPSRLLQDRIVYVTGPVSQEMSDVITMQLLWLDADNNEEPITMFINSPGGSCTAGFAIKDVMDYIDAPVNTVGVGECDSMGCYLLAAGTGTRKATKRCRIMFHAVSSGAQGTVHDMKRSYEEAQTVNSMIMEDFVQFSKGKTTLEQFNKLSERDSFMSPEQAIGYGIIDAVKS